MTIKRFLTGMILMALMVMSLSFGLAQEAFSPAMIRDLKSASFSWKTDMADDPRGQNVTATLTAPDKLAFLAQLLSEAEPLDQGTNCGFEREDAMLTLETAAGKTITLNLAPDSCTVYLVDGRYYNFMPAAFRNNPHRPANGLVFDLFVWQDRVKNYDPADARAIYDLYYAWQQTHHSMWTWPMATWQRFSEVFGPLADARVKLVPDEGDTWLYPLMRQHFSAPGEKDLSQAEATDIALKAAGERLGLHREEIERRTAFSQFINNDEDHPVWKVHLLSEDGLVAGTPFFQIHGKTGDIEDIGQWPKAINRVAAFSPCADQMAEHVRWVCGALPGADDRPACWGSKSLPAAVWAALEKHPLAFTPGLAWRKAHGDLTDYWPIEMKTLRFIWEQGAQTEQPDVPSLPADDEVSLDVAMRMAQAELEKSPTVDAATKARLRPDVNFFLRKGGSPFRSQWLIMFRDPDNQHAVIYSVSIDAGTGVIQESIGPGEGNG